VSIRWSTRGPYWWRRRRGYVLWPLAIGIALCAFGVWSGLVYEHNQTVFRAHAVQTRAIIDKIYTSAPSQDYNAPTFDEYVHFVALGERAQARVLLTSNCSGTCIPTYRVGQALTVAYSPTNPSYAQLSSRLHRPSAGFLYALLLFGSLGVILLGAAVVNMRTA
jgi:Protein of unknown function (DUF3592)